MKLPSHQSFKACRLVMASMLLLAGVSLKAVGQSSPTETTATTSRTRGEKAATSKSVQPKTIPCPRAGLSAELLSVGQHRVVLAWNAGFQSSNPQRNAAGYCLYRSKEQDSAEQMATCSDCEQVTPVALAETSCFDDKLEDGETYYYVVIGVNDKGVQSIPSNEITVQIPSNTTISSSPVPTPNVPSCRNPASLK